MNKVVIAQDGQGIIDITLQEYGSVEGLFSLLLDNNLCATLCIYAGQELIVIPAKIVRADVVRYLQARNGVNTDECHGGDPNAGGDFSDDFNEDFYI